MGLARDPNVNDRKLEDVLATDPVLMFQLLRLVNSAAVGMRGVSSIGQALRLIGRNAFQRWLAVAVAASRKSATGVDQELVRQAVERGRLLEQLGGGPRDAGTLFLVGLFSLLDCGVPHVAPGDSRARGAERRGERPHCSTARVLMPTRCRSPSRTRWGCSRMRASWRRTWASIRRHDRRAVYERDQWTDEALGTIGEAQPARR